jgi:ABC-2 type transport system ATP-binding protein
VAGYKLTLNDNDIRHNVGVLTETPGMYDNLTAEYNLRIFAQLYEVKNIEKQVGKYLKMLGLYDRRFDSVGTFSKGMKQKLAIARALLHEPKLIFLDEPTADSPRGCPPGKDFIAELKNEGRQYFFAPTIWRRGPPL